MHATFQVGLYSFLQVLKNDLIQVLLPPTDNFLSMALSD